MSHACTEERFLSDIARHRMTVLRDDASGRHVRFQEPGTLLYHFELVTWPSHLCISGDCGAYVFARTHDMFEFFRTDRMVRCPGRLYINPSYWAEKVVAESRHSGVRKYVPDLFRAAVKEKFDAAMAGDIDEAAMTHAEVSPHARRDAAMADRLDQAAEKRADIWREIEAQVLAWGDDEYEAQLAVHRFEHEGFRFQDFHERDLEDYTFRFIWNLYAVAWGVKQYDLAKAQAAVHVAPPPREVLAGCA